MSERGEAKAGKAGPLERMRAGDGFAAGAMRRSFADDFAVSTAASPSST